MKGKSVVLLHVMMALFKLSVNATNCAKNNKELQSLFLTGPDHVGCDTIASMPLTITVRKKLSSRNIISATYPHGNERQEISLILALFRTLLYMRTDKSLLSD